MVIDGTRIQQEPVLYSSYSPPVWPTFETTTYRLYITPYASKELFGHTSWGNMNPDNSIEQGGILLGTIDHDENTNVVFGNVLNIVSIPVEVSASPKKISKKIWRDFFEAMFKQYPPNVNLKIIGFYHTQPGVSKIKHRSFDYGILKPFFKNDLFFSVILDPHNTQWKSFRGGQPKECEGFFILPQDKNDLFEIKTVSQPENLENVSKPSELSFTIIKKNELVIEKITVNKLISNYNIPLENEKLLNSGNALIISENAQKLLGNHIAWGRKTSENIVEQGGLLIGKPYQTNENFISIAETIVYAKPTTSNAAYLNMGHDTWEKMLSEYDEKYADSGHKIIGWYHTHPNSLSVFMSGTDMGTQTKFFNKKWHFALVLNPHRKLFKAFYSINAIESNVIVLIPEKEQHG